ncbi:hypothetical protein Q0V21_22225 [Paenibacillus sp. 11B]|uniref:hypothetical protein n=1 Tax=Paenibacillus sp. 11B TaxID=3060965 RepID=UPI00264BE93D|nr:hypothetical protein [Paenibacillus sp. 11B]MDN8591483.1 hypothetical protein [Paenibacillus sp. 11B]
MYELNEEFIPKRGRMDIRANIEDGGDSIAADWFMPKRGCSLRPKWWSKRTTSFWWL